MIVQTERMLTEERHRVIRGQLAAQGSVLAGQLATRFSVSEDTVRRDLRELAKAGECRRVYGGAIAMAPYAGSFSLRSNHAADAKERLAAAAVDLVSARQTLFIDASTTNIAIAKALPGNFELTVATNSIGVAAALAGHELVRLIVLGGVFDRDKGACLGGDTLQAIARISADLFFLGACGVDASRGVTAFDSAEAEVKRAMAANSNGIAIAATTDKLATAAPFRVAGPAAISHLIVEKAAPAGILADFERCGAAVHLAG
jgi:DeoR/GlpR family transcriptional regulator of sugar metabolism